MAYKYSSNPGPQNPPPESIDDDYETSTAREDKAETDETEGSEPTALIPKSLLAGKEFKPGEEIVLKIVHIYEDEVEVEYAKSEEGEETPQETERMHPRSKMMMDTESKLDEIAT